MKCYIASAILFRIILYWTVWISQRQLDLYISIVLIKHLTMECHTFLHFYLNFDIFWTQALLAYILPVFMEQLSSELPKVYCTFQVASHLKSFVTMAIRCTKILDQAFSGNVWKVFGLKKPNAEVRIIITGKTKQLKLVNLPYRAEQPTSRAQCFTLNPLHYSETVQSY